MSELKDGEAVLSSKEPNERTIFVGNIPFKMTWKMLRDAFNKFGPVQYAKIVFNQNGQPRGFGFVIFEDQVSAMVALLEPQGNMEFFGRVLQIKAHDHKPKKPKKGTDNEKVKSPTKQGDVCIFEMLTDNELVIIFSFLSAVEKIRFERVCKKWRRCALAAAKSERHLTVVTGFRRFNVFTEDNLIQIIKRCSPNLKTLDISKVCYKFGNRVFALIGLYLPNLLGINISSIKANRKGLKELAEVCVHLRKLDASDCIKLNDKAFMHLLQLCKSLETLICDQNQNISGEFLRHATPELKHLRLRYCRNLKDEGIQHIGEKSKSLSKLNLNHCDLLSHQALHDVVNKQRQLTELSLGDTSPELLMSLRHVPHPVTSLINPALLTKIELFNSGLYDSNLNLICNRCSSLTYLDISCNKLSDVSVSQLANLNHIRILLACHLQKITDSSLVETVRKGTLLKLRVQGCKSLSDKLIEEVAKHCPLVEEIDVTGIPEISQRSLECLAHMASQRKSNKSKICLYTANNACSGLVKNPPASLEALNLITNYRSLYKSKMRWWTNSDEEQMSLENHNEEMRCAGIQLFRPEAGGPAELYDSDEDFEEFIDDDHLYGHAGYQTPPPDDDDDYMSVQDAFLDNDDPLEYERFDLS